MTQITVATNDSQTNDQSPTSSRWCRAPRHRTAVLNAPSRRNFREASIPAAGRTEKRVAREPGTAANLPQSTRHATAGRRLARCGGFGHGHAVVHGKTSRPCSGRQPTATACPTESRSKSSRSVPRAGARLRVNLQVQRERVAQEYFILDVRRQLLLPVTPRPRDHEVLGPQRQPAPPRHGGPSPRTLTCVPRRRHQDIRPASMIRPRTMLASPRKLATNSVRGWS